VGVAHHLHIRLDEYDAKIRTFIPWYEELLDAAASALRLLPDPSPRVIDLGTGTGALAAACARVLPQVSITAIDGDAGILEMARSRLRTAGAVTPAFVHANFVDAPLPACDAVVASLALHHLRDTAAKQEFYRKVRQAVSANGLVVSADCHPSDNQALARLQHAAWREHLLRSYSSGEADGFFAAWAEEDTYMPLETELDLIRAAGFNPHVVWRRGCFAVIAGTNV
jgi:ubiquinone/menaquinone biosynthesis C-methylase UbiE